MKARDVLALRLANQLILHSKCTNASDVVRTLTAIQAQDYHGALWAIGLRMPASTIAQVERAIATREIVRTWPMRGTLHFVAAEDVRWMLRLLAPRVMRSAAGRHRQLELDAVTFTKSRRVIGRALRNGEQVSEARAGITALGSALANAEIDGATFNFVDTGTAIGKRSLGVHLLPGFDESMLGYRERSMILDLADARRVVPGASGIFKPTIVADGRVVGLWMPKRSRDAVSVESQPFQSLSAPAQRAFLSAAKRYRMFIGSSGAA